MNLEDIEKRIQKKSWFNDEMMNLLFKVIRKDAKVTVWNSQCCTQRIGTINMYNQAALRSLEEKKEEMVLCPYHCNNHWILLVLNVKRRTCNIIDSYAQIQNIPDNMKRMLQLDKKENWQGSAMLKRPRQVQTDTNNCGSYVVTYANLLASGKNIEEANAIIDAPNFSIERTADELRGKLTTIIDDAKARKKEGMYCLRVL
jgi:Ulp1 family protease